MRCSVLWLKSRQPRGMRGSQQGEATACCPITSQQPYQIKPLPHRRADHREEACKTVPPVPNVRRVAQNLNSTPAIFIHTTYANHQLDPHFGRLWDGFE